MIAHGALQPKQRGQLAELPMAEGGSVGGPNNPKLAESKKDPTQRHLMPGDKQPNQVEKGVVSAARRRMESGGDVEMYAEGGPTVADIEKKIAESQNDTPVSVNTNFQPPTDAPPAPAANDSDNQPYGTGETQYGTGAPIAAQAPAAPDNSIPQQAAASPDVAQPSTAPAPAAAQPTQAPKQQPQNSQGTDPFGNNAYYGALSKGIGQEVQGIHDQGSAEAQASKEQAAALQQQVNNQQQLVTAHAKHYADLDAERQAYQKDLIDHKVDPHQYWGSKSTGSKIASAIGVVLGGIGGALTHQANPVLGYLNQQIERDIDAQKANIGTGKTLLEANLRQFGNMRDATDMTRIMMADTTANQLKLAAARSGSQAAQARALQGIGAINQKYAPALGQIAMRQSLLDGVRNGQMDPSTYIRAIVPESEKAGVGKEVAEAQNLSSVRDNTLSAFDQLVKINTVGNRAMNPIQAYKQAEALRGPALDKLTRDTSGRITPETVKLIGAAFNTNLADPQTVKTQRNAIIGLLTQGMHFPLAEQYIPRDILLKGRYNQQGQSKYTPVAPRQPGQ